MKCKIDEDYYKMAKRNWLEIKLNKYNHIMELVRTLGSIAAIAVFLRIFFGWF